MDNFYFFNYYLLMFRGEEKHPFVVPLIYAFAGSFLHVP